MFDLTLDENGYLSREQVQEILNRCKSKGLEIPASLHYACTLPTEEAIRQFGKQTACYASTPQETFARALACGRKWPVELPADQYDFYRAIFGDDNAIIVKGKYTYAQAKNIAKAGTVESIKFDIKNSFVSSLGVGGIAFYISYANAIWNGIPVKDAIKSAFNDAIKAGGIAALTNIISGQVMRTTVARHGTILLRPAVRALYHSGNLGKVAVEKIASAVLGKAVHGGAAINCVSKVLRSNAITAAVSTAIVTAPDLYRTLIARNMSWAQFSKNLTVNVAGVAGGTGGWMAGTAAGAALGSAVPVVGTAIGAVAGGIIGALTGGMAASSATKAVLDGLIKEDAEEMMELVNETLPDLCFDFLFSEKEIELVIPKIQNKINASWLREMYGCSQSSTRRKLWAYQQLEPLFEEVAKSRKKITAPSDEDMNDVIAELFEAAEEVQAVNKKDFNLDEVEIKILSILATEDKCCTYDDIKIGLATQHKEALSRLSNLSKEGLIEVLSRDNKWIYIITDEGRKFLNDQPSGVKTTSADNQLELNDLEKNILSSLIKDRRYFSKTEIGIKTNAKLYELSISLTKLEDYGFIEKIKRETNWLYRITELGCAYQIDSPKEATNDYSDNGFKIMKYLYSQPNHTRNIGYINEATGLGMAVCESELRELVAKGYVEENAAIYTLAQKGIACFEDANEITSLGKKILKYLFNQQEYTGYLLYIVEATETKYALAEAELEMLHKHGYLCGEGAVYTLTDSGIDFASKM